MFTGIVIGSIGGLIVGATFGKFVLAEAGSLKAHVTAEVNSIRTTIATELASLRAKL